MLATVSSLFHLLISQYINDIDKLRTAFVSRILFSCHVKFRRKSMHLLLHERKVRVILCFVNCNGIKWFTCVKFGNDFWLYENLVQNQSNNFLGFSASLRVQILLIFLLIFEYISIWRSLSNLTQVKSSLSLVLIDMTFSIIFFISSTMTVHSISLILTQISNILSTSNLLLLSMGFMEAECQEWIATGNFTWKTLTFGHRHGTITFMWESNAPLSL